MKNNDPIVPSTIWISGVSAAGKTTLGSLLHKGLLESGFADTVFLDGEEIRKNLTRKYGHSLQDRYDLLQIVIDLVKSYLAKGQNVVVSVVSHKTEMRNIARENLSPFMEVCLQCSVEICRDRDYKGDYEKALAGEYDCFPGVTEPYEVSENAELVLNTGDLSIEEAGRKLLSSTIVFLGFFRK
ncbi:MAG: adenylyl-sulfate kinase [Nitrospinaceae bacterium]|nr:adenylyl-sulfate kinase [Nitrospinaceae bacterium]